MDITIINRLVAAARQPEKVAFGREVNTLIGPMLNRQLARYSTSAFPALREVSMLELGNLFRKLPNDSRSYVAREFDQVLGDIVEAASWKISVRTQPVDTVKQWPQNRRDDILAWITHLGETYQKPLLAKLSVEDRLNIADRTLRAVVYSVIQSARTRESKPLFVLHQERVCLDYTIVEDYLPDQIGLYVFLFLDNQAGKFLAEAGAKAGQYVRKQLKDVRVAEAEVLYKEIKARIQAEFLLKLHNLQKKGHVFFLDVQLSTYLKSFARQERIVWKTLSEQLSGTISPDEIPELSEDDDDLLLHDVLANCKQRLDADCQEIIDIRYNNDYLRALPASDMALDMGKSVKSVEGLIRRCLEKLKKWVVAECERQHLIFAPR